MNGWGLLSGVVTEGIVSALTDPRVSNKLSLNAELLLCQTGAAASGVLASQAERVAVSLRKQERVLGERATEIKEHIRAPSLASRPPTSLIQTVRECWSMP